MSLAHLVACIDWTHAKGSKETHTYPPNHTSLISLICCIGLGHAQKEYNIIYKLGPQEGWDWLSQKMYCKNMYHCKTDNIKKSNG